MPHFSRAPVGLLLLSSVAGVVACSSSSSSGPPAPISSSSPLCTGTGRCVAISASATEAEVDGAFATAKSGDTIALAAGTYTFKNQLALANADNVTIVGAGQGMTV